MYFHIERDFYHMHVIIRLIALMKDIHTGNEGSYTVLKEMKPSHFLAQVLRVALTLVVCMTLFHRIDPTEDRSPEESWLPCLSTDDDWTWYPPPPRCDLYEDLSYHHLCSVVCS